MWLKKEKVYTSRLVLFAMIWIHTQRCALLCVTLMESKCPRTAVCAFSLHDVVLSPSSRRKIRVNIRFSSEYISFPSSEQDISAQKNLKGALAWYWACEMKGHVRTMLPIYQTRSVAPRSHHLLTYTIWTRWDGLAFFRGVARSKLIIVFALMVNLLRSFVTIYFKVNKKLSAFCVVATVDAGLQTLVLQWRVCIGQPGYTWNVEWFPVI